MDPKMFVTLNYSRSLQLAEAWKQSIRVVRFDGMPYLGRVRPKKGEIRLTLEAGIVTKAEQG
jgi:hypothetical protein